MNPAFSGRTRPDGSSHPTQSPIEPPVNAGGEARRAPMRRTPREPPWLDERFIDGVLAVLYVAACACFSWLFWAVELRP